MASLVLADSFPTEGRAHFSINGINDISFVKDYKRVTYFKFGLYTSWFKQTVILVSFKHVQSHLSFDRFAISVSEMRTDIMLDNRSDVCMIMTFF